MINRYVEKEKHKNSTHTDVLYQVHIMYTYSYALVRWPGTIFCLASLYVVNIFQDPNSIEHETVALGNMHNSVVDKPKKNYFDIMMDEGSSVSSQV